MAVGPAQEPRESRRSNESGAIAMENLGIFPVALFLALIAWQVGVIGFSFIYAGHATTAAARSYSITGSQGEARKAANAALPGALKPGLVVTTAGDAVTVRVKVPLAAPAASGLPQEVITTRSVTVEP